jgi:hypothetical protein
VAIPLVLVPWLVGQGPAGIELVLHHGSLEERRIANAEGAATAFVPGIGSGASAVTSVTAALASAGTADEVLAAHVPAPGGAASTSTTSGTIGPGASTTTGVRRPVLSPKEIQAVDDALLKLSVEMRNVETSKRTALLADLDRARSILRTNDDSASLASVQSALATATVALHDATNGRQRSSIDAAFGSTGTSGGSGLSGNVRQLPVGLRVMVVDPLPLRRSSNSRVQLAQLETIVWYPVLALALLGLLVAWRRPTQVTFTVLAGAGVTVMYALSEGNFGTAYRHRGEIVWAVALLAGFGYEALLREVRARRAR